MLRVNSKPVELALMLLHVGALSGSAALISIGRLLEALLCAAVASACVLIMTGALALAEVIGVKITAFVARHNNNHNALPKAQRSKEDLSSP